MKIVHIQLISSFHLIIYMNRFYPTLSQDEKKISKNFLYSFDFTKENVCKCTNQGKHYARIKNSRISF